MLVSFKVLGIVKLARSSLGFILQPRVTVSELSLTRHAVWPRMQPARGLRKHMQGARRAGASVGQEAGAHSDAFHRPGTSGPKWPPSSAVSKRQSVQELGRVGYATIIRMGLCCVFPCSLKAKRQLASFKRESKQVGAYRGPS